MTHYTKCTNCAVDKSACTKRAEIRNAIKGLGVTSVKFNCADRVPMFREGQRVSFTWIYYDENYRDGYGYCDEDELTFHGTVSHENEKKRRFVVRVDDVPVESSVEPEVSFRPSDIFKNGGFAVSVRPDDITALDEPDRKICRTCLAYEVDDLCQSSDYWKPLICLKGGDA